ncbi:hypothetical protein [Burkholderia ubonensis]|uniref:hypothetical protein n=1 Tax=Burkholderia ubonensis TaxID=101571 RepID=UPI000A9E2497|nr:hypothetical protein [Burkholderia ubonensis]
MDAILRRMLDDVPKRGGVLNRHYGSLDARDVGGPMEERLWHVQTQRHSLLVSHP